MCAYQCNIWRGYTQHVDIVLCRSEEQDSRTQVRHPTHCKAMRCDDMNSEQQEKKKTMLLPVGIIAECFSAHLVSCQSASFQRQNRRAHTHTRTKCTDTNHLLLFLLLLLSSLLIINIWQYAFSWVNMIDANTENF